MNLKLDNDVDFFRALIFGTWVGYVPTPYVSQDVKIFRNTEGVTVYAYGVEVAKFTMVGGMIGESQGAALTPPQKAVVTKLARCFQEQYEGSPIPVTSVRLRRMYADFQFDYSYNRILQSYFEFLHGKKIEKASLENYYQWIAAMNNPVLRNCIDKNNYLRQLTADADGLL